MSGVLIYCYKISRQCALIRSRFINFELFQNYSLRKMLSIFSVWEEKNPWYDIENLRFWYRLFQTKFCVEIKIKFRNVFKIYVSFTLEVEVLRYIRASLQIWYVDSDALNRKAHAKQYWRELKRETRWRFSEITTLAAFNEK